MALPNKKINKIKLPVDGQGSQTYEIIPERLENGGYEAALPTLTQDSVLALQGEAITQVESAAEVPDNVSGLYRYPEEASFGEQSSHVIEVMRKDYDESEVIFEKTTQTNNTQLTSTTFFNQFADALPGWLSISAIGGVYALYYNLPFNGIRFGAGSSAGSMTFTLSADCDITFYKYFSYNGSTQEIISYDAAAKAIVDGTDYTFVDDTTPVVVHLAAGQHTVSSYYYQDPDTQEKTTGRIILTKFEFEGEPYSAYEAKELARVEEVQAVDAKLEQHKTESHNRFVADEQAIAANRQGITDINGRMGDIQTFQSAYSRLPTPSVEYVNKLYRDKYSNALFQCVDLGQGVAKDWSFSGVGGTSEITASNVDSFYADAGDSFGTYFSVNYEDATTKFYRNNGSLKLGSSGSVGQVELVAAGAAGSENLSRLKIGVKAYNANGSTVEYEVELCDTDNGSSNSITGEVFVSDNTTETLIDLSNDIPSGYCLSYLDIRSVAQHNTGTQEEPVMVNNDKRLVVTRLIMDLGEVSYTWVPEGFAQLTLTDNLLAKNIPVGGAYLYIPEYCSGYVIHKYDDGSSAEFYFQNAYGYYYYEGNSEDIKNTSVQDILDEADWNSYVVDSNLRMINTTNTSALTPQASESLVGNDLLNLHKISKTGSYNDLLNKPTIPTVNNGALTIQGNGTAAATFTANQSGNSTLNIKGSGGTTVTKSADGEITISSTAPGADNNQTVKVGDTTFGANDAVGFVAGTNITSITADTSAKTITINAKDTTYSDATTSASGLMSSSDKTKLNGIATGAEVNVQSDWNVTDSSSDAFIKNKPSLGTAAPKNFTTSVTQNSADLVTSGAVWTAIDNLPDPMVFKGTLGTGGTITTLPAASASNTGFTYKVITAGTYQSLVCKVGDVVVSNGTAWVLIPAGDTDTDTWRNVKVNGTELLGTAISTGAVNFKNGSNVTISGSGNDITISASQPTVNNGTLTIQKNGTQVATFTANQSGNSTANITVPTTLDDISDGSTRKLANYLPLSGGSMSGGITARLANGTSGEFKAVRGDYSLFFGIGSGNVNRGIFDDTNSGWIIYRDDTTNVYIGGPIYENGTALSDKYLGKAAKAADADKLDGQDGTYYLNYNNLSNKPTIPTVNNATLTIQKNGSTVKTFTANASTDVTANITVPTVPTTTTANKLLVSTSTSDSPKWSDWSTAGLLKTNTSGVISVDTNNYLTTESDTLGTVLNRGNTASKDIDLNDKDFFNAGTRKTAYIYSTSQDPQTQYYWFKITPPPSGASDRYYLAVESDVNYPYRRGNYLLDISNYSSGTSYNISLNELSATGNNDTVHLLNVAADASGNVYVQAFAAWTSYLRFIRHNSNSTTQTYPSVGSAAFGTVSGFTSLKMISDTGCIRILNGANDTDASRTGHTQLHSDSFIENGTTLSDKYLGKTAKAADADKLDGQDGTYYLNYNNLSNKPTIPTVNNATLTIQKNGTNVNTFTANASSNVTANITVPTSTADITNDRFVRYDTASQGLTDTQKSNARTNIGAGTSSLTIGTTATTAAAGNHTHSAYVNQNAFSNVKVGSTTIAADTTTDTLELAGSNVTLTPDATNDKVTIGITSDNIANALGYTPTANTGTITGVSVNGTSVATSGVANITSIPWGIVSGGPTVNNATLTIQKNGTTVKTFTANASTDVTANITVPTSAATLTGTTTVNTSSHTHGVTITPSSTNAVTGTYDSSTGILSLTTVSVLTGVSASTSASTSTTTVASNSHTHTLS